MECPYRRLTALVVEADEKGLLTFKGGSFYDYSLYVKTHGRDALRYRLAVLGDMPPTVAERLCAQLLQLFSTS